MAYIDDLGRGDCEGKLRDLTQRVDSLETYGNNALAVIAAGAVPGRSGTVAVGTVATGAPGSSAAVTNTGTPSDGVFNFLIPVGQKGDPGSVTVASANSALATTPIATPTILSLKGGEGLFYARSKADDPTLAAKVAADPLQAMFAQSTLDPDKVWVRNARFGILPEWFGVIGNDIVDDSAGMLAAIALLKAMAFNNNGNTYKGSARLFLPAAPYFLGNTTLDLTHTLIVEGESTGMAGGVATKLRWSGGCTGIRVQRFNTFGDREISTPTHFAGDACSIRGLALYGGYSSGANPFHAVDLIARAQIRDCQIYNWQGNGVNIVGTAGAGAGGSEGNANGCVVDTVRIGNCSNGTNTAGADANQCSFRTVDCSGNRAAGFREFSFLGNSYTDCHTSANAGGAYVCAPANANNASVFTFCYSEGDQTTSIFGPQMTIISGQHAAGVQGGIYRAPTSTGEDRTFAPITTVTKAGGNYVSVDAFNGNASYRFRKNGVTTAQIGGSDTFGITYDAMIANGKHRFFSNSVTVADIDSTGISLPAGRAIRIGGVKVAGEQQTGIPDTSGATLAQLEVEKNKILAALRGYGLIGP